MLAAALHTRAAQPFDRRLLENLLSQAGLIHNHLDWNPPYDWLGKKPFHLAFLGDELIGALAAPPDPPDTAWIRLAAIAGHFSADDVLTPLWAATRDSLAGSEARHINCMLLDPWLAPYLEQWGFGPLTDVVILRRERKSPFAQPPRPVGLLLRPAGPDDLPAITAIDHAAFQPPWQYSPQVVQQAMHQCSRATVAVLDHRIVGYEISSGGRAGGHLARLAVLPALQGQGIGRLLTAAMIEHFQSRGAEAITVNTQRDNLASISVYRATGFELTGESYEVWQYRLAAANTNGKNL